MALHFGGKQEMMKSNLKKVSFLHFSLIGRWSCHEEKNTRKEREQGCQIFLGTTYQKR
jgi:hypothetical protein